MQHTVKYVWFKYVPYDTCPATHLHYLHKHPDSQFIKSRASQKWPVRLQHVISMPVPARVPGPCFARLLIHETQSSLIAIQSSHIHLCWDHPSRQLSRASGLATPKDGENCLAPWSPPCTCFTAQEASLWFTLGGSPWPKQTVGAWLIGTDRTERLTHGLPWTVAVNITLFTEFR